MIAPLKSTLPSGVLQPQAPVTADSRLSRISIRHNGLSGGLQAAQDLTYSSPLPIIIYSL